MASQAEVVRRSQHQPSDLAQGAGDLAHDVIELGELQVSLLKADAADAVKGAITPVILIGVGAVVMLSTLPVLVLSVGYLVAENVTAMSTSASLASTAGVFVLVFGGMVAGGAWLLTKRLNVFSRSMEELSRNIRWIKTVLKHGGGASTTGIEN